MHKKMACLGVLVYVLGTGALLSHAQPQMFLQTQSPKSLPDTVKAFKEEVAAGGWSILNVTNMAGVLSEKGYTISPVLMFDLCSGKFSAQILTKDEHRLVTPLMPCRVSIYQTAQGIVIIARLNAKRVAPMFSPELAEIMLKSSSEGEVIIEKTISRLSKVK